LPLEKVIFQGFYLLVQKTLHSLFLHNFKLELFLINITPQEGSWINYALLSYLSIAEKRRRGEGAKSVVIFDATINRQFHEVLSVGIFQGDKLLEDALEQKFFDINRARSIYCLLVTTS